VVPARFCFPNIFFFHEINFFFKNSLFALQVFSPPPPLLASIIIINYYKKKNQTLEKYVLCVLAECMCAVFLSYIESITFKKHKKK
jgi:hypothetical protein